MTSRIIQVAYCFTETRFEIFPAGALGPFRIEHSGQVIRRIAAFDPIGQEVSFRSEGASLLIPCRSDLRSGGKTWKTGRIWFDYCERVKWIAGCRGSSGTAQPTGLSTIEGRPAGSHRKQRANTLDETKTGNAGPSRMEGVVP